MDPSEARDVLGVGPGAGQPEVRSAFRRAVRAAHPDSAGSTVAGHAGASVERLVRALAVLRDEPDGAEAPTASSEGEDLLVDAPPDEAFLVLLAAADRIGDVTHAEPENGLFEAILNLPGTAPTSLLVTLQGRGGSTEAFCTLEPIAPGIVPAIADVVALLAEASDGAPGVPSGHAAPPRSRGPGP